MIKNNINPCDVCSKSYTHTHTPRSQFGLGRLFLSSPCRNMTVCLSTQLETCALLCQDIGDNNNDLNMILHISPKHNEEFLLFFFLNQKEMGRSYLWCCSWQRIGVFSGCLSSSPRCYLVTESQLFSSFVCKSVFESCNKLGLYPPYNNTSNIQRRSFIRHERVFFF